MKSRWLGRLLSTSCASKTLPSNVWNQWSAYALTHIALSCWFKSVCWGHGPDGGVCHILLNNQCRRYFSSSSWFRSPAQLHSMLHWRQGCCRPDNATSCVGPQLRLLQSILIPHSIHIIISNNLHKEQWQGQEACIETKWCGHERPYWCRSWQKWTVKSTWRVCWCKA